MLAVMKTVNYAKTRNARTKILLVVLDATLWLVVRNAATKISRHVKKKLSVLENKQNVLQVDLWQMVQNVLRGVNVTKVSVFHIVKLRNFNLVCVTLSKMLANDVAERI